MDDTSSEKIPPSASTQSPPPLVQGQGNTSAIKPPAPPPMMQQKMTVAPQNPIPSSPYPLGVTLPNFRKTNHIILEQFWDYLSKTITHKLKTPQISFECTLNKNFIFNELVEIRNPFFIELYLDEKNYLSLIVSKDLIYHILYTYLTPLTLGDISEEIIAYLLDMAFFEHITACEQMFGMRIKFKAYSGTMQKGHRTQWILKDEATSLNYGVTMIAPPPLIKECNDKLYRKAHYNPLLSATISMSIITAVKQFPMKKINSLKHGEIIILMIERHPINEPLGIISQRLAMKMLLSDMQIQIISPISTIQQFAELYMNQGDVVPPSATTETQNPSVAPQGKIPPAENIVASMADMRVPVTFELGKLDIPVSSLTKLAQGHVLDLQKPINENISLIVNNKVIALGEIVQVGRNFGVIIKEVL